MDPPWSINAISAKHAPQMLKTTDDALGEKLFIASNLMSKS
jgi:hypothetical protein